VCLSECERSVCGSGRGCVNVESVNKQEVNGLAGGQGGEERVSVNTRIPWMAKRGW
jgi:hypothetical protein